MFFLWSCQGWYSGIGFAELAVAFDVRTSFALPRLPRVVGLALSSRMKRTRIEAKATVDVRYAEIVL